MRWAFASAVPFLLAVVVFSAGCAASKHSPSRLAPDSNPSDSPSDDDVFRYSGDDDSVAATRLARFLERHDFDVRRAGRLVGIRLESGLKIGLEPKMMDGPINLDRIVANLSFRVKDAYRGSNQLARKVAVLNRDYNTASFWIDSDGDIMAQTAMTFVDEFSWDELDGFLNWVQVSVVMQLLNEDMADMLR